MDQHEFLRALTIVLCVAGLTTVIFQRLRQPVVLGYILAGVIVGPHVPIPLIADSHVVETLSEVGVILLMFSLGLEFSLRRLVALGPTASVTAIIQCSIMIWLGFMTARVFGWTTQEGLYVGALIAISSTTIIAKAFDEQKIHGRLRELVVGVLIVEDLIAILLMTALTAMAAGRGLDAGALVTTTGKLLAFLAGLLGVGLLVVPPAIRAVRRLDSRETVVVASVGLCFAVAMLAYEFGYSVALGAFIAGSLIAESGEGHAVGTRVEPVRDMFAAIFFVSVGMLIDPAVIVEHWLAVVVLTLVVVVGKVVSVSLGAFLAGNGIRLSLQAGMSLAQIGEFSFIIAGLGIALGATRDFIYPVAVAVSAVTTLSTPWLIRAARPAALLVDRKLPRTLQTFGTLYGSWIEGLRTSGSRTTHGPARRLARLLGVDLLLLIALVLVSVAGAESMAGFLDGRLGIGYGAGLILIAAVTMALSMPLLVGMFRVSRRLGVLLAESAMPRLRPERVDLADAPRRAFVVTLQLAIALLLGLPLLAVLQPFLSAWHGAIALATLLAILGFVFWRRATNLEGHVKAGAAMIIEVLTSQARKGEAAAMNLEQVGDLLPGLGTPTTVRLEPASHAVGKTLADLHVRGLTGATVLAIGRGPEGIVPSAEEVLRAGDLLALAGTRHAVQAATQLLRDGAIEDGEPALPGP
jgi:CPA2 family monovalent cation:H+ antiporter-2